MFCPMNVMSTDFFLMNVMSTDVFPMNVMSTDVLSQQTFCLPDVLSVRMFFTARCFDPPELLTLDVMSLDVLSKDVLSGHPFKH
jgi:hypothetical protein